MARMGWEVLMCERHLGEQVGLSVVKFLVEVVML